MLTVALVSVHRVIKSARVCEAQSAQHYYTVRNSDNNTIYTLAFSATMTTTAPLASQNSRHSHADHRYCAVKHTDTVTMHDQQALELDAHYVKAWAKKGDIEFFMKEYHKALESYQQGLQVEPNNSLCVAGLQKTKLKVLVFVQYCFSFLHYTVTRLLCFILLKLCSLSLVRVQISTPHVACCTPTTCSIVLIASISRR
jgi:tetratricopeptide (TPR) repeat protein